VRRLFWVAVGATAGVYAARRVSRAARAMSPDSAGARVAGALGDLAGAVRDFTADVREGMAEREEELRDVLGLAEVVETPRLAPSPVHAAPPPGGPR
jgi:Family of unknown function (DUF6167)